MNEIKCPNCGQVFKVDESGFADIVKQVRDHEFEKELREREQLMKQDKENAVKLAEANTKFALQEDVAKKDAEIARLKEKIEASGTAKILEITEAVAKVEKERDALANELNRLSQRSARATCPPNGCPGPKALEMERRPDSCSACPVAPRTLWYGTGCPAQGGKPWHRQAPANQYHRQTPPCHRTIIPACGYLRRTRR